MPRIWLDPDRTNVAAGRWTEYLVEDWQHSCARVFPRLEELPNLYSKVATYVEVKMLAVMFLKQPADRLLVACDRANIGRGVPDQQTQEDRHPQPARMHAIILNQRKGVGGQYSRGSHVRNPGP